MKGTISARLQGQPRLALVILMGFKVVLKRGEDGYVVASVPSLPGCHSQGKTRKEALKNINEAISLHTDCLAEDGILLGGKPTC